MNVQTITMPKAEASRRLAAFRRGLRRKADSEWQRAAIAYEQLEKGTPLLVLSEAIQRAPFDEKGRPMLAIARADRPQVCLHLDGPNRALYCTHTQSCWRSHRLAPELSVQIDLGRSVENPYRAKGFALVPMVPPDVLGNRALRNHYILWDVQQWSNTRIGATPDRDPYLLTRVADDLFAVVGEWDLTDVERAVMRDRARA